MPISVPPHGIQHQPPTLPPYIREANRDLDLTLRLDYDNKRARTCLRRSGPVAAFCKRGVRPCSCTPGMLSGLSPPTLDRPDEESINGKMERIARPCVPGKLEDLAHKRIAAYKCRSRRADPAASVGCLVYVLRMTNCPAMAGGTTAPAAGHDEPPRSIRIDSPP
jgi:hypothetical protein